MALPEYAQASTVMFYIDVRSEVRTRHDLELALQSGKTIIVPWCNDDGELELFRLASMDELEVGMYKILEPRKELRSLPEKQVNVEELDLIMVPRVTTTSFCSTLERTRLSSLWRLNASCSNRFLWPITTSSWTRSSAKIRSIQVEDVPEFSGQAMTSGFDYERSC
jgi:hypothetical protein